MDFKLADFYDIEAGEPTDRLKETVTTILAVYESFLANNPVYRILLVGGIVREDTAVEGRKDIDFLLVPCYPISEHDEEHLYSAMTSQVRRVLGQGYDVFVKSEREQGELEMKFGDVAMHDLFLEDQESGSYRTVDGRFMELEGLSIRSRPTARGSELEEGVLHLAEGAYIDITDHFI
ncbi:TPA: hypothetical protein HA241_02715 [Candidatus Woesearchaeota archaeon]|nr:hypothetical protein [Candidatus Woesearchaeota archaeon]